MVRNSSLAIVHNGCSSVTTHLGLVHPVISFYVCVIFYTDDSLSCLTGGAAASVVQVLAEGRGTNVESDG